MDKKRNFVKEYNEAMKQRIAIGMPIMARSMVTIGQSFVIMTHEGIKTIEWSEMNNSTKWEPINEIIPSKAPKLPY